ncbi:MAG: leucine--tRNA ligase [Puniceicoccales bacterium]|jgi:leucyl-tRNA synthetase|nr:leucine--tRNA ligase [Puniceicoccales bacterium]
MKAYCDCDFYDFQSIESFWQTKWLEHKTFATEPISGGKKKYYVLDMFPYPSGAGLHIGHPEGYTASDILARYKRSCGFNVLHPMGWDAFGLPAEQHAILTGQAPDHNTTHNIEHFRQQILRLGFSIDWDREINTTDPDYYRWTQWIFLQLFKHGLAYVDEKPVWWCQELKSVLANEEVINGRSERGNHPVERKNLRQWVLRITAYADKLLENLNDLDWPESTKQQQIAWIGRSEGAEIQFDIEGHPDQISVYTTRCDTIYGTTYLVLAPEHPLLPKIVSKSHRDAVEHYITLTQQKSDLERTGLAKEKTGVFTGAYAIHPLTQRSIPLWVADYVLGNYGTGAVMAVPAHDERDFAFAKKFGLEIISVVHPNDSDINDPCTADIPFCNDGILYHSQEFDSLSSAQARQSITQHLESLGHGKASVQYKLRDWLFSRQRYWGEPIPILWVREEDYNKAVQLPDFYFREFIPQEPVSYQTAGITWVAIPLTSEQLPLQLPKVESYHPSDNGESPLQQAKDFCDVRIHIRTGEIQSQGHNEHGGDGWISARRETNTMPQWAGSCWYHLRYLSPKNTQALVDPKDLRYWGSPDFYIGGAEHAVLHLLYARFWHRFLFDLDIVQHPEPYPYLFHQGIILGEDGSKMSKSRGNIVNPDDIISAYGADALRLYEMFLGPLESMKPWSTHGIEGVSRFLKKVWRRILQEDGKPQNFAEKDEALMRSLHETIYKVTKDIEHLRFNTAISQMMIFVNEATQSPLRKDSAKILLQLLAPFAPHIAEELWHRLGEPFSIIHAPWPQSDPQYLNFPNSRIVIMINGKPRDEMEIPLDCSQDRAFELAKSREKIRPYLQGRGIPRIIWVPQKLLNLVLP